MDTSSAAAECVTLQAAAGFTVHLFPTGQGNVVGNPEGLMVSSVVGVLGPLGDYSYFFLCLYTFSRSGGCSLRV